MLVEGLLLACPDPKALVFLGLGCFCFLGVRVCVRDCASVRVVGIGYVVIWYDMRDHQG